MVGAAVVHVGSNASTHSRNSVGSKAPGQNDARAGGDRAVHGGQAVDVKQRHHVQAAIRRAERQDLGQHARRGVKVALRERDDLGLRGRARRVEHQTNVIG